MTVQKILYQERIKEVAPDICAYVHLEHHLEEYLQMKVKGLPNEDGPRTPHRLLGIVLPIDSMPLAKIDIYQNESLY